MIRRVTMMAILAISFLSSAPEVDAKPHSLADSIAHKIENGELPALLSLSDETMGLEINFKEASGHRRWLRESTSAIDEIANEISDLVREELLKADCDCEDKSGKKGKSPKSPKGSKMYSEAPSPAPTDFTCEEDEDVFNLCIDVSIGITEEVCGVESNVVENFNKAIVHSKEKLESIIIGDRPSWPGADLDFFNFFLFFPECKNEPGETVDDIFICALDEAIDGPGGILSYSGPFLIGEDDFIPTAGYMVYDTSDTSSLIDNGLFEDLVLHDLAQVMGMGSMWQDLGLVTNIGTERNPNYVYTPGTHACDQWQRLSGCDGCPPLDNDSGGYYWDKAYLQNELMTPYIDPETDKTRPFSRISVGALDDIGFVVDYNMADEFPDENTLQITCPDSRQRVMRGEASDKPGLSPEGFEECKKFAEQFESQLKAPQATGKHGEPMNGTRLASCMSIDYLENGNIYHLKFGEDCPKHE